jgi:hypothetical protein
MLGVIGAENRGMAEKIFKRGRRCRYLLVLVFREMGAGCVRFFLEIFGQGVKWVYLCGPPLEIGWLVLNNQEKKGEKGEEKKRK